MKNSAEGWAGLAHGPDLNIDSGWHDDVGLRSCCNCSCQYTHAHLYVGKLAPGGQGTVCVQGVRLAYRKAGIRSQVGCHLKLSLCM